VGKLAKRHDLLHLAAQGLVDNDLCKETIRERLIEEQHLAVFRVEQIQYELAHISQELSEAKIAYIPLKGAIIRQYYPEPWHRTCCDIDILIKEADIEEAVCVLKEKLGYTNEERAYHDVSLLAPSGVHLELHFSILEKMGNIDKLLEKVWGYAEKVEGKEYEYGLTNEFLLFHVVAHGSYHFLHGGCGVRSLLDLYLLEKKLPYDQEKFQNMLKTCSLVKFYEGMHALACAWFQGEPLQEKYADMQAYILGGGIYGTMQNRIAVEHVKAGGRRKYLWRRIFMPYSELKKVYPALEKHKWLTPFYQVRRWGKVLLRGKLKTSVKEWNMSASVGENDKNRVEAMMKTLGL
jgi:hypothetical protein